MSELQRFAGDDDEIIERALVKWAEHVTGLQCVWEEENGPQPSAADLGGAYVTLSWLTMGDVGDGGLVPSNSETAGKLDLEFQVTQVYGVNVTVLSESTKPKANALYFARALLNSLAFDDITMNFFDPDGIAVKRATSNMLPQPGVRDSRFISRAAFDFGLTYAVNRAAGQVDAIESVEVSSALTAAALTAGGTLTIDGTV